MTPKNQTIFSTYVLKRICVVFILFFVIRFVNCFVDFWYEFRPAALQLSRRLQIIERCEETEEKARLGLKTLEEKHAQLERFCEEEDAYLRRFFREEEAQLRRTYGREMAELRT